MGHHRNGRGGSTRSHAMKKKGPSAKKAVLSRKSPSSSKPATAPVTATAKGTKAAATRAATAVHIVATSQASKSGRHKPPDSKQAQLIGLLQSDKGATIAQLTELTQWQPHTVRALMSILK